jgi:putative DNA primase/helicase
MAIIPNKKALPKLKQNPSDALIIRVDGDQVTMQPDLLADSPELDRIKKLICAGRVLEIQRISRLLQWSPRDRVVILQLLLNAQGNVQYVWANGDQPHSDLFKSVIASPPSEVNAGEWDAWILLACEILACTSADVSLPQCNQLLAVIKKGGLRGYTIAQLAKTVSKVGRVIDKEINAEQSGAVNVRSIWPDLPEHINPLFEFPPNWEASAQGIRFRRGVAGAMNLLPPMLLVASRRNLESCEFLMTIAYRVSGEWIFKDVPRGQIADGRKVIELANFGMPVNSLNSSLVVQYLADYEVHNQELLKPDATSDQLGWQGQNGNDGFLLGRTFLPASKNSPTISYAGSDVGMAPLADGYETSGTLDAWKHAVKPLSDFDRPMLALYASFAAPLLRMLDLPSFCIDFSGPTTTGKTTAVRLVASGFGRCGLPGVDNSLVRGFNATATWRERYMQVHRDVPVILDDTKHARDSREISDFIYGSVLGASRGRGTPTGTQRQLSTRAVIYLTGEQSATAYNNDGGAFARVLTIWGPTFGKVSPEIGHLITQTMSQLQANYGHAGREYISYLVLNAKSQKKCWKLRFGLLRSALEKRAGNNSIARRLAPSLAAIQLAALLAHEALDLPWAYSDPVSRLFDELAQEAAKADLAAKALRDLVEYASANSHHFYGGPGYESDRPPAQGWLGVWSVKQQLDPDSDKNEEPMGNWAWIGIIPQKVKDFLTSHKYDAEAVMRTWADRKWLMVTKEKGTSRNRMKVRLGGTAVWLVAITPQAYRSACEA